MRTISAVLAIMKLIMTKRDS